MPQKLFHRLKVGAVVEHCGGKAVAQDVGTAFLQHDDTPELRFNQIVYLFARERFIPVRNHKTRTFGSVQCLVANRHIRLQIGKQSVAHGDQALFAAFAVHLYETVAEIDIGIMQINSYWLRKYGWPVEQVLEPRNNAKIGVWILAQEIRRHGLTWRAVAYYHTPLHRYPERGRAYAQSIVRHVRNILAEK